MSTEVRMMNVCGVLQGGAGPAQVILNGSFTGDTNWTHDGTWVIGTTAVATASTTNLTAAVAPLVAGSIYRVTFTVTVTTNGIRCLCGTTAGATRNTVGTNTYTEDIVANGTGFAFEDVGGAFTGVIDNVTAILLNPTGQTVVTDEFASIDTSPPNSWADVGGTLDETVSTDIIVAATAGDGSSVATTTALNTLHTGYFSIAVAVPGPDAIAGAVVSTKTFREVTLSGIQIPLTFGSVSLMMDMANTTPVYTTGLRMKVEKLFQQGSDNPYYFKVTLYVNDAPVATGTLSPTTAIANLDRKSVV